MVLSFNWYKYSVVIGFLKKKVKAAVAPDEHWSGTSWPVQSEGREVEYMDAEEVGNQSMDDSENEKSEVAEELFQLASAAKKEVSSTVRECAINNLEKWELLLSLRNLLKPYMALAVRRAYAFRFAINNAIEVEVKKYYSFHLSGQDLVKIWQSCGE